MGKRDTIKKSVRIRVLMRDGHACQYCGARASEGAVLHVDHVKPVCRGGTNDEGNLVTSCRDCNLGKGSSDLFVSREEHERVVSALNDELARLTIPSCREYERNIEDEDVVDTAYGIDFTVDLGDEVERLERFLVDDFDDYGCNFCSATVDLISIGQFYICRTPCLGSGHQDFHLAMEVPF